MCNGPEQRRRLLFAGAVALVLAVLLLYFPTLHFDFLQWDDDWLVQNNPLVQSIRGAHLKAIFFDLDRPNRLTLGAEYLPLRDLVTMLDWQLWGGRPQGFHLTNLLLYLGVCLLFYGLLARHSLHPLWVILAALLFAVHPGHVESVAWISERKSLLALFFLLLSFHAYLDYRQSGQRRSLGLSLLAMAAAALAKQFAILLPLWLAAYEWTVGGKALPEIGRKCGRALAGFAALALAFTGLHYWVARHIGILGWRYADTAGQNLFFSLSLVRDYLEMLFLPQEVTFLFVTPQNHPPGWIGIAAAAAVPLLLLVLAVAWRRRRPWIALALLWFLIGLLPFLQIVPIQNYLAWRYLFPASLALGLMLAEAGREKSSPRLLTHLGCAAVFLLAALYARQTLRAVPLWRDSVTFWQAVLAKQPRNTVAWNNLSAYFADRGEREEALRYAQLYVAWRPDWAGAWYTLGVRLSEAGQKEAALPPLRRALKIDPDYAEAWLNLGLYAHATGDEGQAEAAWRELRRRHPRHPQALQNLLYLYLRQRRFAEAESLLLRLAEAPAQRQQAEFNLALLAVQRGEREKGERLLRALLARDPHHAAAAALLTDLQRRREKIPILLPGEGGKK